MHQMVYEDRSFLLWSQSHITDLMGKLHQIGSCGRKFSFGIGKVQCQGVLPVQRCLFPPLFQDDPDALVSEVIIETESYIQIPLKVALDSRNVKTDGIFLIPSVCSYLSVLMHQLVVGATTCQN